MASGGRVAFVPPSDAVQEFKVESATFDAQQGHTAGATVNVAIKSGTNNFRGTGYFFYRDEKLSTNEYFLEKAGKPKSKMDYTRWGGTLGGPIHQEQDVLLRRLRAARRRVPRAGAVHGADGGAAERRFLRAALAGHPHLRPGHGVPQLPTGRVERLPFPGNVIPANRISPIAQNYLKYYPHAQPGR